MHPTPSRLTSALLAGAALFAAPPASAREEVRLGYQPVAGQTADGEVDASAPAPTSSPPPAAVATPQSDVSPADFSDSSDTAASDETSSRDAAALYHGGEGQRGIDNRGNSPAPRTHVAPYIEAQQVVDSEFSPQSDTAVYTALAAGVDASIAGRNSQGTVSLRYERQIAESRSAASANVYSGLGRVSLGVVPQTLQLDAAGYATRIGVLGSGAALPDITVGNAGLTQIYGLVAGPTLSTGSGDLHLDAHYHIGYNHVGTPGNLGIGNAPLVGDIAENDTTQDAAARLSTRAGDRLPVGLAIEGGYYQEDISVLAQRVRDAHVRGEVTIPVAQDVALIGGLGYEDVQVSSRNALLDANGNPVVDGNGQIVTDNAGPRYIAFDTSGLIWDAGVEWRPSPRTSLEAHIGRRYGDIGGYGLFSWHPTTRQALNVAVYNNMAGFGGALDTSLIDLSAQFETVRNALTGNLSPCVGSATGGACLTGALGSLRSSIFRSRGVSASYTLDLGRLQAGVGAGYDHRRYIAAAGTVLASENGEVDRNVWVTGFVTYALDRKSSLSGTLNAYWFRTGLALGGDLDAVGATAAYQRTIGRNLSASAAIGIDAINRQALATIWDASGELGLRYTF